MKADDTIFERKLIASRLKKLRRFHNITREDIAASLGITKEQYKDLETGKKELSEELIDQLIDLRFDDSYILEGIHSVDKYVEKALEVMPDKEYKRNVERLIGVALPAEVSELSAQEVVDEWNRTMDLLFELAAYGADNYFEKVLRDIPEVRFLTNRIEGR